MDEVAKLEKEFPAISLRTTVQPRSFLFILLVSVSMLLVIIISIGSYFLYGENHTPSVPVRIIITKTPTPTPLPLQAIDQTADWKLYTNTKLKISFKYPPIYQIIRDTPTLIILGAKESNSKQVIPYLTINTRAFIAYQTYKACSDDPTMPCLNGQDYLQKMDIADTELASVSAKSFYYTEGASNAHHVVITTQKPLIELNMNVAGGGLDYTFTQILSSFKFTP